MEKDSPISSETTNYHSYQNTPMSEHSISHHSPPQGDNNNNNSNSNSQPQGDNNNNNNSNSNSQPHGDNNNSNSNSQPHGDNNNNNSNSQPHGDNNNSNSNSQPHGDNNNNNSNSNSQPHGDNNNNNSNSNSQPHGDNNNNSNSQPHGDNNNNNNNNNSNSNSQPQGIEAAVEAVKTKCYEICLQWLLIAWAVFMVIATASEIGHKILADRTSAKCLRVLYFGVEAIHVFMVYKVLYYGPQLPIKTRLQFFVMFIFCGGFTTTIMFMVARDSPFDMWGMTPLVCGPVWLLAGFPLICPRVPILPL